MQIDEVNVKAKGNGKEFTSEDMDKFPKSPEAVQMILEKFKLGNPFMVIGELIHSHNYVSEVDEEGIWNEIPTDKSYIKCFDEDCATCKDIEETASWIGAYKLAQIIGKGFDKLTFNNYARLWIANYTFKDVYEAFGVDAGSLLLWHEHNAGNSEENFKFLKLQEVSTANIAKFFDISIWSAREATRLYNYMETVEEDFSHLEYLQYVREGKPLTDIARVLGVSPKELTEWRSRSIANGLFTRREYREAASEGVARNLEEDNLND